jgi:hypothetical protein
MESKALYHSDPKTDLAEHMLLVVQSSFNIIINIAQLMSK